MKFCLVKKVADKAKEIAKKVLHAITEANKKRAERAISWELRQYYKRECGDTFLEKFPYHVVNRRD